MFWSCGVIILTFADAMCAQTFDFKSGIENWTRSQPDFDVQTVCGPKTTDRFARVKLGGDYWSGLTYPLGQNNDCLLTTAGGGPRGNDGNEGWVASPEFPLRPQTPFLSLRIGGTSDAIHERVELQIRAPAADAAELQRRIMEWWKIGGSPVPQGVSTRDGDFIIAFGATGHDSEALRQEVFAIPRFLLGMSARIRVLDDSPSGHLNLDYVRFTAQPPEPFHTPVWGYADYHTHPMSYLAFGGLKGDPVLWGNPGGNFDDYIDPTAITRDLPHCIKGHGGGYFAEPFISQAQNLPTHLGLSIASFIFPHRHSGGPEFKDFPDYRMGAHEQMHITQIRRNYEGGLRLMVGLATDNMGPEFLTGRVVDGHVDLVPERISLEAQLRAMKRMAELNRSWMEIAYNSQQARSIILHDKLCVILGIEVDQLGSYGFASYKGEIDYLWGLGARVLLPVHAINNDLGGPALFGGPYNWLNDLLYRGAGKKIDAPMSELYYPFGPVTPEYFSVVKDDQCSGLECVLFQMEGFQLRLGIGHPIYGLFRRGPSILPILYKPYIDLNNNSAYGNKNRLGLTPCGNDYLAEMMDRGMIIDTAHMSDRAVRDTIAVISDRLAEKRPGCRVQFNDAGSSCDIDAYPAIVSHAHFRSQAIPNPTEPIEDFKPREYDIGDLELNLVRRIGGVVGPFVAEGRINASAQRNNPNIANDCWMSSKNFAFSFRYALERFGGVMADPVSSSIGMATDITLIPQVAPRFGKEACEGFLPYTHGSAERRAHPGQYNKNAQGNGVLYFETPPKPGVKVRPDQPKLMPYRMGERAFDFNIDGLAHFGMMPDMLQDLKNVGMTTDEFQALFSSAEGYLRMWEKVERLAGPSRLGADHRGATHLNCRNTPGWANSEN